MPKYDPMSQKSEEAPQCPEDARGPDYSNNHPNDRVRGNNEDATKMPHFDSPPRSKMRR